MINIQDSPACAAPGLIVFSDLDGTLLDHANYSWAAAEPAVARLRKAGIPLVLASSKTAAEIAPIRARLGFDHVPAIVENGAGILPPGQTAGDDTAEYDRLRAALDAVPAQLRQGFQGFGDWDVAGIARHTGLSTADAALAARRQFSEPGLWHGTQDQKQAFVAQLLRAGIKARDGGRFMTLSFGGTKAARMDAIISKYGTPFSVALGDAPNDVEMLERADLGIVVANPHHAPLPRLRNETAGRIRRTSIPGPAGWNAAMLPILAEHGI